MQWRDTPDRFGLVTRLIHWTMAGLILWQLTGMALRALLGRQPVVGFFVGLHQPLGGVIFLLILLRIFWALSNSPARPRHQPGLVGRAAALGHLALYALMLVVPLLGLLRAWGSPRGYAPWGFEIFAPRAEPVDWAMAPANLAHGPLAWTLAALTAGHVAMVLIHVFVWRDGIQRRMLAGTGY